MDDYIKRCDAIEALGYLHPLDYNGQSAKNRILKIPAADVRPVVRGRWLSKEYMYGDQSVGTEDEWVERLAEESDYYAYCSVCGNPASYSAEVELVLSNFCPHCGADMR